MPFDRAAFAQDLTAWFRAAQRDLPWRRPENSRDAYRVLVSEFMLQQTTVAAVIPYFERFIARFPDVRALAEAPEEEVLGHWAGLGYYARARNLQRCAREVTTNFGAQFPNCPETIQSLPGIGRYTAGAVASIAFGQRAPIVDANVARVLSRVLLLEGDLKSASNQAELWDEATRLVSQPNARPEELNPGLMELGALICSPRNPRCDICPVAPYCAALRAGRQNEIPHATPRPELTAIHDVCAFATREDDNGEPEVLLRRRPDESGLWWRGMWELPRTTVGLGETTETALHRLAGELGLSFEIEGKLRTVKHGVTRYAITLECWTVRAEPLSPLGTVEASGPQWMSWESAQSLPLPSSMQRLLKLLRTKPARQLTLL